MTDANRNTVLSEGSVLIGARWARGWCEEMIKSGRAIAGGWPGTMPEARARVAAYLRSELSQRAMLELSADELAVATRSAYQKAKLDWLRITRESMPSAKGSRARRAAR
jgi:hypothetical protein